MAEAVRVVRRDIRLTVDYGRFYELVAKQAYAIWQKKEGWRRERNRSMAQGQLRCGYYYVSRENPVWQTIRERAYEIYEQRKVGDAFDDWLEAEQKLSEEYRIRD